MANKYPLSRLLASRLIAVKELCDATGISVRMYHQYANGSTHIPVDKMVAICKALEIPVPEFLEIMGYDLSGIPTESQSFKIR